MLDSHLAALARRHPSVKFLRSRAVSIGFALKPRTDGAPNASRRGTRNGSIRQARYVDPDDDPSDEEEHSTVSGAVLEDDLDDDPEDEAEPDYDMLPTMLIYRGGELAFSWPRVDLDIVTKSNKGGVGGAAIDQEDVEALLTQYVCLFCEHRLRTLLTCPLTRLPPLPLLFLP